MALWIGNLRVGGAAAGLVVSPITNRRMHPKVPAFFTLRRVWLVHPQHPPSLAGGWVEVPLRGAPPGAEFFFYASAHPAGANAVFPDDWMPLVTSRPARSRLRGSLTYVPPTDTRASYLVLVERRWHAIGTRAARGRLRALPSLQLISAPKPRTAAGFCVLGTWRVAGRGVGTISTPAGTPQRAAYFTSKNLEASLPGKWQMAPGGLTPEIDATADPFYVSLVQPV